MSFKGWLSIITFVFIALILVFSRHELIQAWQLLESVNLWILALVIPTQLLLYYSSGMMVFTYIQQKGALRNTSHWSLARMSLELNFVNHVLPSGGLSGFSYMNWRLGKLGVSQGRAAMAQVVRYAVGAASFFVFLMISVLIVTIDGSINRWIVLVSSMLVTGMIIAFIGGIYLLTNLKRMKKFSEVVSSFCNTVVKKVSFGRFPAVINQSKFYSALEIMHRDYVELRKDQSILLKPFLWSLIFTVFDVGMFLIVFWALGHPVNPAPVLIAYGVATISGVFVLTPGGSGAYETIMVGFLAIAGLHGGVAIAGIVLTRVIEIATTIVVGYIFYQKAISKGGYNATAR